MVKIKINEKKLNKVISESVKKVIKEAQQYDTIGQMKEVYDLAKSYGLEDIANFVQNRMDGLQRAMNGTSNYPFGAGRHHAWTNTKNF